MFVARYRQCPANPMHVWPAAVRSRAIGGSGCPLCTHQHSRQEVQLAFEIKHFFPFDPACHDVKVSGRARPWNVDIRIEEPLPLAIEFDSSYWHAGEKAHTRDVEKTQSLTQAGWTVVRAREAPLEPIGEHDVVVPIYDVKECANQVLLKLRELTGKEIGGLEAYLNRDDPIAEEEALAFWTNEVSG